MTSPTTDSGNDAAIDRAQQQRRLLFKRVCALIIRGHSLRAVAAHKGMPRLSTLGYWLEEDAEFRATYERAREMQSLVLADDVVAIADAHPGTSAAVIKLRIEARKWLIDVIDQTTGSAKSREAEDDDPETRARIEVAYGQWRRQEAEERLRRQN